MSKREKRFSFYFLFGLALVTVMGWCVPLEAQQPYPTKPINLIVGFPPGGATDIAARTLSVYLEKKWGTRVNVVNKPGGNAIPAVLEVLNATPDGYTLLADVITSYTMLHISLKDVPFKPTDRNILGIWGSTPDAWFVPGDSPFKSMKDVEEDAKRDPENFTWTSLGGPAPQDFCLKQFFRAIGVNVSRTKPVMSKGGAQVVAMVAGGHVKLGLSTVATTLPAVKSENIRVLAVTTKTKTRWPELPDIPTIQEAGYGSITFSGWVGVSGPQKLPPSVIDTWSKALQEMTKDSEMISKLRTMGMEAYYLPSKEAREFVLTGIEEGSKLWSSK